jgi:LPS-assembly protein
MNNNLKGKAKYISASIVMALIIAVTVGAADKLHLSDQFYKTLTADSIPVPRKSKITAPPGRDLIKADSFSTDTLPQKQGSDTGIVLQKQKVDTFNFKISKDTLDAPVYYHADDSMVMDVPTGKITLYGKQSNTKYQDNELTAPGITFDQKNNLVTASFIKDSAGNVIASPTFKQGELLTVSDSIAFNMKSGKGLTKGTYTQQGEMFVYGERIKKVDSNSFYAYKARITTCNLDTPHFAFVSKKIKFINQKFAVTGPVHPEFEGIPIPIILPFGIYPMFQGRHSGLIAPNFTSNDQFGLALEGLGYYKVINDNWDVVARGTFYSYGGWTMQVAPRYYKRYHYTGNLVLDIQHTKFNFKGDPDYSVSNTFKVRWSHNADTKARPGVTFGANVDISSTKFNQFVPNSPVRNFNNILTSSISYAKVWKDKPFNINILANHTQNTNLKTISLTLPNVAFNMNTVYPFRRKEAVGNLKWYENIGVALNTNAQNQTNFSDDTAVDKRPVITQIRSNLLWGIRHSIPISLSLPPIGALQVSPGISYAETWYQKKTFYNWDERAKKLDTTINKGFYTAREMSFSLSLSTRIFGMFGFGKNSKIKAIRHEIRPQLSISYKPDMNKYAYYNTQVDTLLHFSRFSYFKDNLNSPYGEGKFGGISFGLDNNIQMKVKDRKDTSEGATKKVTLIDGLSISGGYNFLVDSFQLSTLSLGARTNLFDKVNITFGATLDPYQYDTTGRRINRLVWKDKVFTLGRLTGGNISLSTSFQGGDKSKAAKKKQSLSKSVNPYTGMPLTDEQEEAAYISNNPAEYTDFSIPWSLNVGYSLRFNQLFNQTKKKYGTQFSSDINLSGSIKLTEKWQLGLTGIYNFTSSEVGMVSLSIAREMHCWQMSINVSPVGKYKFFNITISPKSALLRDIKVNRTRYFYDL